MWRRIACASLLLVLTRIDVSFVEADIISSAYKGYKTGKAVSKFLNNVLTGLDIYNACSAAGGSQTACGGKVTLCFLYQQFGSKFTKGIWQSGYAESLYRNLCLGQPVLKCCYRENDKECHTAFNSEAPINCEGNPNYGPTSTAGLCRRPCATCSGCLCNYIPKCQGVPPSPRASDHILFGRFNDPGLHVGRMDNFMIELGYFFRREFNDGNASDIFPSTNPLGPVPLPNLTVLEEVTDFVRFRGCQSFSHNVEILGDGIPVLVPINYRDNEISRPNDLIDQIPAIRMMLPYFIVARLVLDIPQFWLKIDYVNAIRFNTTQIDSALTASGITDPARVMLDWIDYGGLWILHRILGEKWKLLAIPVNQTYWNLTETPETPNLLSCAKNSGRASPVDIDSFKVGVNGAVCLVNMTLAEGQGQILVRALWGDRSNLDETILNTATTGSLLLSHTYTKCGSQRITIQLTNEGRLRTLVLTSVNIPCSIQLPPALSLVPYPNVAKVFIQVNVSVALEKRDSGRQFFLFEGASNIDNTNFNLTDANATYFQSLGTHVSFGGKNLPQLANITFRWDSSPLEVIRFTCRTIDSYKYSASAALINKVQIELMNREIIDLTFTQSPPKPILCARRGDEFEDIQEIGILTLFPAAGGTVIPPAQSSSIDEYFKKDGYYYEQYPNRFTYSNSIVVPPTVSPVTIPINGLTDSPAVSPVASPTVVVTSDPTSKPSIATATCGIFGFGFICPLKCGFWKRLLGLGGC